MAPTQPRLPFDEDEREGGRRLVGILVAILVHVLAGAAVVAIRPIERVRQVWVEAVLSETEPPPPPPPPELPVEPPPPPKERRKVVEFEETVEDPTPDAPVESTPADKPVRVVQGLSATSFAAGSGVGFSVRAGTTVRARANDDLMDLDEAASSVAFSSVTRQPRVKSKPALSVPQSVQDQRLTGVIKVLVDIDDQGEVTEVRLVEGLHPEADRACLEAWRAASFSPAMQGETAVAVRNAPFRCRIEQLP